MIPSGTPQELSDVAAQPFLTVTESGGKPRLAATQEMSKCKQGSRYEIETSPAVLNWTGAALTVTVTNQNGAVTFPPGSIQETRVG